MKNKDFISMILGTLSGIPFALGMCMVLLQEWQAMVPGIILGVVGLLGILVTILVRRKMENKPMLNLNLRTIAISLFGIISAMIFGIGVVMSIEWGMMIWGVTVGITGIILLMFLIPMVKGFEK